MKKILFALTAVALLFATSCKKQNAPEDITLGEGEFLATIDNGAMPQNAPAVKDGMTTKTTIDKNRYVIWESGDQIKINGSIYTTSTAGNKVEFTGEGATDPTFHAFYPASIAGTNNAGTLPETQTFEAGYVRNLPMYATSTTNQLTFHNICAVFAVTAPLNVQVASIEISTPDSKALWGTFSVDNNNTAVMTQTVDADHQKVTLTCNNASSQGNIFYIALPAETYDNIKVTITTASGSKLERETNAGNDPAKAKTLEVNKIYSLNFSPITTNNCFRFKAIDAGATINYYKSWGGASDLPQLEYSTDGYYWSAYTLGTDITMTNAGDSVMFRAPATHPNATMCDYYAGYKCIFATSDGSKKVAVKGNIMMLLNGTNPSTNLSGTTNAFTGFFANNNALKDASDLILPNTTGYSCYQQMFTGCSSLKYPPVLPAMNMAENCYHSMFQLCSKLETAPALPAMTLAASCYESMFEYCWNLTSVTMKATDVSANKCLTNWLNSAGPGTLNIDAGVYSQSTTAQQTAYSTISGASSGWTIQSAGN